MDSETNKMFELILQKLDNIDKRQETMEKRLDAMDKRFEIMEKRLDAMEERQNEIYSVVKAIEHSSNVRKAEIDNLTYKVAHVEGTINGVGELIQSRRSIK